MVRRVTKAQQNKMAKRLGEGNNLFNSEFDGECQKIAIQSKAQATGQKSESFGCWKI